jgi:DNA-binding transcriptional LysR family regulator
MAELRHLRYFVAVAEELNFSRAAERLHMAQPPLSVAIRQLEQEVGAELFERTSREVKLTAAGQAALVGAYRTLADAERTLSDARRAAAGEIGSVRVAFSWSARFEILPAVGQAFRADHPDVKILIQEMWNARMLPALRSGAVDVALSLCPELDSDFSYETIRSDPLVALVAAGYPPAGEAAVALGDLRDREFLMFPRELAPRLYEVLVGVCRNAGFEPSIGSDSFHSGWELRTLADPRSVTLVPAAVARHVPDDLVTVPLSEPAARVETTMVWRMDDPHPAAAAFRDVARRVYAPETAGGAVT